MSWDRDAVHRSDEAIIKNIDVLGSNDCTCDNCDKTRKEISEDDNICLEIHSVALTSASDDVEAIYANDINPHDILMRIPVPKCDEETNTPCLLMISKLIGSATSRQIL